jgi:hypothetical protein
MLCLIPFSGKYSLVHPYGIPYCQVPEANQYNGYICFY